MALIKEMFDQLFFSLLVVDDQSRKVEVRVSRIEKNRRDLPLFDLLIKIKIGVWQSTLSWFDDQTSNFHIKHIDQATTFTLMIIMRISQEQGVVILRKDFIDPRDDLREDIVGDMCTDHTDRFIFGFGLPIFLPIRDKHSSALNFVDKMLIFQITDSTPDCVAGNFELLHEI